MQHLHWSRHGLRKMLKPMASLTRTTMTRTSSARRTSSAFTAKLKSHMWMGLIRSSTKHERMWPKYSGLSEAFLPSTGVIRHDTMMVTV